MVDKINELVDYVGMLAPNGVTIKAALTSEAQLPETGKSGDAYLVGDNLYIWVDSWVNVGPFRGPKGDHGRDAVYNFLINSDFSIAQAGYGGNHGKTKFAADMWPALPSVSGVLNNGQEITFTATSDYGGIYQKVKVERIGDGDSFTFAFRYKSPGGAFTKISRIKSDGTYLSDIKKTWFDANANDFNLALITISRDEIYESDILIFNIQSTTAGTITIKHPVLYKGSYTADTLPAYVPKGYAAELETCRLYARPFIKTAPAVAIADTAIRAEMVLDPPMRIAPTITIDSVGDAYTPDGKKSLSGSYSDTNTADRVGYVFYTESVTTGAPCVITEINGFLSSDM